MNIKECSADMKILQVGQTSQDAGVENAVRLICSGLSRANHSVRLVTDSAIYADEFAQTGVQYSVVDLADRSPLGYWKASRLVRKLLKEFQPDVIHVHGRSHVLICLLAGRRPDCFTLHSSHLTHRMGLLDRDWIRPFFPQARRTIAISEESVPYVQKTMGVKSEYVDLVYNGVDCNAFHPPSDSERSLARQKFDVDDSQTLAIFVGRFHEQKQPEALIELAEAVKSSGSTKIQIALVGGGHLLEMLQEAIAAKGVSDICKLYPWMSDPSAAYWAADVCLLPSLHEGFALTVVEALACGCPIIRTRTGGWQAMIREGETGFSTEIDTASFVKIALPAIKNTTALNQMRENARRHAVEELSIEKSVAGTLAVYQSAIQRDSATQGAQ
jgi:glycosyltransferase involved in cell wall biosynthesis